jgi:hypothetical protein
VRRAFFCALIACGFVACRYDYDALMGTGGPGTGGSSIPGTGGDVAAGGRGGAAGSLGGAAGGTGGGPGGTVGARGGTGGGSDAGGATGSAGRGGEGGATGTGGAAGAAGRGGSGGAAGRGGDGGAGGRGGEGGQGGQGGMSGRGGVGGTAGVAGQSGTTGTGGTAGTVGVAGQGGGGTTGTGGTGAGGTAGSPSVDPVLWYKFDDGTGSTAMDSSTAAGAPHNGTFAAVGTGVGMFSTTHQVGTGALSLSGTNSTNGAYINIPTSLNALGATTAITIACWVNITTDRAWGRLFDFNNTTTTGYMFLTTYQSQSTPSSVRFAITATNNAGEQQISSTARLSTATWHHVAVVLDAGATYTGTLYIDGAVAGTNTAMTVRPSTLGNTANNWIGRSAYTADPYFAGLIDDFRVYNRALSAAEITTLFSTVR